MSHMNLQLTWSNFPWGYKEVFFDLPYLERNLDNIFYIGNSALIQDFDDLVSHSLTERWET